MGLDFTLWEFLLATDSISLVNIRLFKLSISPCMSLHVSLVSFNKFVSFNKLIKFVGIELFIIPFYYPSNVYRSSSDGPCFNYDIIIYVFSLFLFVSQPKCLAILSIFSKNHLWFHWFYLFFSCFQFHWFLLALVLYCSSF